MKKFTLSFGIALLACLAPKTQAAFHLFDIQEVFSSSDGLVQYIELFSSSSGQQFVSGHQISFDINTTQQQTLTFGSDLPGSSLNKSFLVGTANLTALYGVTPDYVIPANFFAAGSNNFINFGLNEDKVSLASLPTNGVQSLNGNVSNSTPTSVSINSQGTPTNFAGQTATIPEPGSAALLLVGSAMLLRRRRK